MTRRNQTEETLDWGEIYVEDLLRSLYKGKNFATMSDSEVDQMLEDLI